MSATVRHALLSAVASLASVPATAQTGRLPIMQGVWVPVAASCGSATNVFVYVGGKFGSLYFYGPNQSMGPADETEAVSRVSRAKDGFWMVNEGPLEVAPRPDGRARVRAYSQVQGETWSETVRLCPPATLSAKMRQAVKRVGPSRAR